MGRLSERADRQDEEDIYKNLAPEYATSVRYTETSATRSSNLCSCSEDRMGHNGSSHVDQRVDASVPLPYHDARPFLGFSRLTCCDCLGNERTDYAAKSVPLSASPWLNYKKLFPFLAVLDTCRVVIFPSVTLSHSH